MEVVSISYVWWSFFSNQRFRIFISDNGGVVDFVCEYHGLTHKIPWMNKINTTFFTGARVCRYGNRRAAVRLTTMEESAATNRVRLCRWPNNEERERERLNQGVYVW